MNKDLVSEPANALLTVIEQMELLIALLMVEGPGFGVVEAQDIQQDLYYLYGELVKHEQ